MSKMTGGEALAKSLTLNKVEVIFGLPGVQLYHALDGLSKEKQIRFITTRHEQATTYMADGYSRASGKIGVAMVVPGPGLQNASAGIGTAFSASSPILVISGQIERDSIGMDQGKLHEVNDQMDTIAPVTKWRKRITDPQEIPSAVNEAFNQLNTGRPRPVEIEIPPETLADTSSIELLEPEINSPNSITDDEIRILANELIESKNPLLWVGGGAISSGANDELLELVEFLQCPVILTNQGKGAFPENHDLCLGSLHRNEPYMDKMKEHDLSIAIGTRMGIAATTDIDHKLFQIDIDDKEIGINHPDAVPMVGDAKASLKKLLITLKSITSPREPNVKLKELLKFRKKALTVIEPQASLTNALRDAMPEESVFVSGMTQIGYYSRTGYPVNLPRTHITSSYYGNLGYAYPTALGAKVGRPDLPVLAVSGDGGFLFNSQEMATAKQFNINATVVVFNDNAYGNVMRDQKLTFDGRVYGSELENPDFEKLAEAYGINYFKANSPDELNEYTKKSFNIEQPTFIEVPVGPMPKPWK
ncbi:MAG: thiamine pyrophosphate-dependent enzyme [Dehalococcoidia bacterium]|tara:strand:+ start:2423 stop:4021 length:1599 start_codon:yes stop_codon:yes gene_type:complete